MNCKLIIFNVQKRKKAYSVKSTDAFLQYIKCFNKKHIASLLGSDSTSMWIHVLTVWHKLICFFVLYHYYGKNLLEIQNEHLYFFASPGAVNQFSIQSIAATLNFSNQMLWYKSTHNFSSSDMQAIFQEPSQSLGNIVAQGFSKGQLNLSSQNHHNFLSIKTQDFSVPIYNEYFLQILQAQLFISNLSQGYFS